MKLVSQVADQHNHDMIKVQWNPEISLQENVEQFGNMIDWWVKQADEGEEIVFVGNSAGGYMARYFASLYENTYLVMMNPSLDYYDFEFDDREDTIVSLLVAMNDEVVDPNATLDRYKDTDANIMTLTYGGHRLNECRFEMAALMQYTFNYA